jgi:hypothetical protein
MNRTKMGWVVIATVALAVPSEGQSQASTGAQMAAHIEDEASKLHDQMHQWGDAADLYVAAAQLRADDDPQAQRDLFVAANMFNTIGDTEEAIAALESAGARAVASGDVVRAAEMFAVAALVAQRAGLRIDQRRLGYKSAQLANSPELTSTERTQILSRFQVR